MIARYQKAGGVVSRGRGQVLKGRSGAPYCIVATDEKGKGQVAGKAGWTQGSGLAND